MCPQGKLCSLCPRHAQASLVTANLSLFLVLVGPSISGFACKCVEQDHVGRIVLLHPRRFLCLPKCFVSHVSLHLRDSKEKEKSAITFSVIIQDPKYSLKIRGQVLQLHCILREGTFRRSRGRYLKKVFW